MDFKTCSFVGHRTIADTEELRNRLYDIIEGLIIDENVNTFLFGSKSKFDELCHKVVTVLKEKYPNIRRIYIRAEFQDIDDKYKAYILKNYEDTYFSNKAINAVKAAYIQRNYEMIDNSDYCVVYYDENYLPPSKTSERNMINQLQKKSGTKFAYEYALKNGIKVINVI